MLVARGECIENPFSDSTESEADDNDKNMIEEKVLKISFPIARKVNPTITTNK